MLSKKSKYAIKALLALAKEYGKGPVLISSISDNENIPKKFLEAILLEFRKTGVLGSKRGVGGGYYLIKPPEEVMLSSVMRLTDGPIALVPCVSINFYERCEECVNEEVCGLRNVSIEVRDASLRVLSNTSIASLLEREKKLIKSSKKQKS
jgi:Rrf2 family protein